MASYNRVILVGNLTRDPQLRYLPNSQTAVVEFGMAINHRYKSGTGEMREEVCFIDVVAFGKQAETINTYCQKGKNILVEGRLKLDTWEDKQGGGKRSKHRVVIDNFQFLGSRGDGGGAPSGGAEDYDAGGDAPPPRSPPAQRGGAPRPPAQRGPAAPSGPPAQGPAPQQQEPPFGDEQQFGDDEIPF